MFKAEDTLRTILYGTPPTMRLISTDCSEENATKLINEHGVRDAAMLDDELLLELGNSTALRFFVRQTYDASWLECEQYTRVASPAEEPDSSPVSSG
jgi:hypothetical protein